MSNFGQPNISDDEEESELDRRLQRDARPNALPKPKNSSKPTFNLESLLVKAKEQRSHLEPKNLVEPLDETLEEDNGGGLGDNVMVVDVNKLVGDYNQSAIKELTKERINAKTVIVPKGKEKQKNQITYLAQLSKATQSERDEQAALGRLNKAAARSKYGW